MFVDEIAKMLDLDGTTSKTYSAYLTSGKGFYIEGKIKIINCSSVRIDFSISGSLHSVLGENLKIKNLTTGSMTISGDIFAFFNSNKLFL